MTFAMLVRLQELGERGREQEGQLPAEPWMLGLGAFLFLCLLLLITWQFNRDR